MAVPTEALTPAVMSASECANLTYCKPLSLWCTRPWRPRASPGGHQRVLEGQQRWPAVWELPETAQPTKRRVNTSVMNAI